MADIILRTEKGTPLTNAEVDQNFIALNQDKYEEGDTPIFGAYPDGNYVEIDEDGHSILHGDGRNYDDVYPSSIATAASGPNAAAFSAYAGNMKALEFVGTGAQFKEATINYQIYHSYQEGTSVSPHLHLHIPDNAAGGTIKFYAEIHWDNVNDTGAVETSIISGVIVRAPNAGISKNHILSFGELVGTGKLISSILSARVYRDPTDVEDTFEASVWLKSADVHIHKNTSGSKQPFTK